VMELIQGESLSDKLREGSQLPKLYGLCPPFRSTGEAITGSSATAM